MLARVALIPSRSSAELRVAALIAGPNIGVSSAGPPSAAAGARGGIAEGPGPSGDSVCRKSLGG
eukprot:790818-Pyramimonas_sp.AAC.1